jgi:hypothetical protein
MHAGKAITILKTWTNSWATSHRSHDPTILPCLLGCKAKSDSLIHYLHCPHLYALMKFVYRTTDDNPLIRFGLVNPNLDSLSIICCTSAGYHAIRRSVRASGFAPTDKDKEISSGDVRHFWTVFADAFTVEARERSAPCARFSVASFSEFLIETSQERNTNLT